jgi:polygalacturonase
MYCKNILIEGISIRNSPFWTVNPEFCENVTIHAVTINNPHSPNTDGINPESCNNVRISNCHITVGDDCITIKSGKDGPGRKTAVPAQNYTITNCTMLSGHGGVVIGSEMSGDVRKIVISNCVFDGTDRGIRIKSARGRGGVVEEIRVSNIVMKNIKHMGETDRNKLLEKSFDTFNKMFQTLSTATNTDDVDVLGLVQNSIDLGVTDRIAENFSVTNMEDIKQKLFDVAKSLNVNTVSIVKKLINPFKTITNRGPRYNALVNKCNKLLGMICLSVWYYIIYAKINNMSSDNDMMLILMGGRKKRKPKKKSNS